MVVISMANGVLMPKFPLISPWFIGGSAILMVGTALMCESTQFLYVKEESLTRMCRHH